MNNGLLVVVGFFNVSANPGGTAILLGSLCVILINKQIESEIFIGSVDCEIFCRMGELDSKQFIGFK